MIDLEKWILSTKPWKTVVSSPFPKGRLKQSLLMVFLLKKTVYTYIRLFSPMQWNKSLCSQPCLNCSHFLNLLVHVFAPSGENIYEQQKAYKNVTLYSVLLFK